MNFVKEVRPREQITCPGDANRVIREKVYNKTWESYDQEQMWVLLLNTRSVVTHQVLVYVGTINSINVRVCELFKESVRKNSSSIIIAHNHPSGDPNPSPEDVNMTKLFTEAGKLLGIEVLDHIIIGENEFFSLKERDLLC